MPHHALTLPVPCPRRRGAIFILLLVAGISGAQGTPLSIHPVGPDSVQSKTREAVTLALGIENTGTTSRTVSVQPILPEGWRPLVAGGPFSVEPGAADVRIESFLVPSRTPAGTYPVRYRVQDASDPTLSAECELSVVVLPEISLSVHVLDSPSFVIAGSEYTVSFVISNTGNGDATVRIDVVSGAALPFEIRGLDQPPQAAVPAGGAVEFRVAVRTDAHQPYSMHHPLQVTVRVVPATGQAQGQAEAQGAAPPPEARTSSLVEVVPLSVDDRILTHTIPVDSQTTATTAYDQGFRASIEQEIKAAGTLDEAGEHRIELDVNKQLDTGSDPLLDPLDRYSVEYESRFGAARLGDLPYTVSPLLVQDVLARGAQGTVNFYPVRVSGLYFQDIWSDYRQGLGGGVDFTLPRAGDWNDVLYRVGLNVLSPLDGHTTFDLLQRFGPSQSLQFQADAAVQTGAGGPLTPALYAQSDGSLGPVSWTARYIRAWPDFVGTWSDYQSILALSRVALLNGALSLHGIFSLSDSNLDLNPSLPSADRTMEVSLGAGGEVPVWKTKLELGWENWRRVDRLPVPSYSTWDNIVRLSARQPLPPFTLGLQTSLDFGRDDNQKVSSLEQAHTVSFTWTPTDTSEYGVSLRYGGRLDSTSAVSNLIGGDLQARYAIRRLQVEGLLSTGYIFSSSGSPELQAGLSARLVYAFPWTHTITVRPDLWFVSLEGAWTPTASLTVMYDAPFDMPVSRKPNTAIVTGRVFNAATGVPMAGVVLRLDDLAAMTDAKGGFTFYVPRAGTRYLQVDRRTITNALVPVRAMPMQVVAPGGSRVSVDVGMIEGCTVSGTVAEYGYADQSNAFVPAAPSPAPGAAGGEAAPPAAAPPTAAPPEPARTRLRGLANILLELSDGTEVHRKLTNPAGDFSFTELRPGKYTLKIVDGNLPEYSTVDPPQFDLDLTRGETRTLEFRALDQQRRIQILQSGESVNIQSSPAVEPGATIELQNPAPAGPAPAAPAPGGKGDK